MGTFGGYGTGAHHGRDLPPAMEHDATPPDTDPADRADAGALVVAGIGASAGGVEALEAFFAGLPEIDGVAFVVVLHLAPDEESRLADVLQRGLPLPVTQVTESVEIQAGHVYIIPPGKNLLAADGTLTLEPIEQERIRRRPVDHFFRTLVYAYGERAVGVVLSGTGANGTVGVRALKEAGGLILAQDPADAAFDEMPRTAIAAGVVDGVGPAGALAAEVTAYAHRVHQSHLPGSPRDLPDDGAKALRGVLAQLRARTGHDFADYKRATVLRRIERRMHVTGVASLGAYLDRLRGDAAEAQALLDDLLISVTNFFRDPAAFEALAAAVPGLFEGKGRDGEVRAWVAGCATGEEAYSVAMVLLEHAATLPEPPGIQVFATDLSGRAIQTARAGAYPESIEADVSPARLRRFFAHENGRYRVTEALREAVLFAPHDLLADAPFSRVDLVSCRNVLIYFQRSLQQRALALFHYALLPDGLLMLGTSETPSAGPELFTPVDGRAHLYRRLDVETPAPSALALPRAAYRPLPLAAPFETPPGPAGVPNGQPPPVGEVERVHESLREQTAPPSVLVDEGGEVAHVSRGAAPFLQVAAGAPTRMLTRVLRPELRAVAQAALFQARREGRAAESGPVKLELDGEPAIVTVRARPAPGVPLVQVVFDVQPASASVADPDHALGEALRQTQEQLQTSVEEFETSREELRAQNEELQSINEELRSTAEELETAKEEAQSMAEELRTVNDELKAKVDETARAKGDLENLIASTEIATLFLDRGLRIQRFTPRVRDLFHVRASDVGRPLADLAQRFGGGRLVEDAGAVVERLDAREREVEAEDGRWYLVHARPYRTVEDRIDGVVVTFVDITRRKADELALRQSEERYRSLFGSIDEGFCVLEVLVDEGGAPVSYRYLETNPAFARHTGLADAAGKTVHELAPDIEDHWVEAYGRVAETGRRTRFVGESPALGRWFEVDAFRIGAPDQRRVAVLFTDVTQRVEDEREIRRLNATLEARVAKRTQQTRRLSERLAVAEQKERRRIAVVLHDDLQQRLAGLSMTLHALWNALPDGGHPLQARADEILNAATDLTRTLASELSPAILDREDFSETLNWIADAKQDEQRLAIAVRTEAECPVPDRAARDLLYHSVRELLFNVAKHAGTGRATLAAWRDGDEVVVTVEDQGAGFDASADTSDSGLGLYSVRERIEMADGRLDVASEPGKGARVTITLPAVRSGNGLAGGPPLQGVPR